MEKLTILLSNDDGIEAEGLNILGTALAALGDVYVAAPTEERSASSHAITMRRPLQAIEHQLSFAKAAWAINGLPVDCVKLAMDILLPKRPDIIFSGINNGANMGNDVLYSGTVGAAMEGYLYGLPAIAVSVTERKGKFDTAAEFAVNFARCWQQKSFSPRALFNINVPGLPEDEIKGWRYTSMGWRFYNNVFETIHEEGGQTYYWMHGDRFDGETESGQTDVEVALQGYISVTPLQYNLTNYQLLDDLLKKDK